MKDEKSPENRRFEEGRLTREEFEALNIRRTPPPAINAPGVVLLLAGTMLVIHACLQLVGSDTYNRVVLTLAFLPARFQALPELGGQQLPGGELARVTSFFSYALLHGSWTHLVMNMVWMLAFGSVAARRLGTARFIGLSMLAAAVAAAFSMVLNWGTGAILVGASGAIAGQMAVAVRLIFAHGGTLMTSLRKDLSLVPPEPLVQLFSNKAALIFIAIWLGIDMLSASSGLLSDGRIAWEAHLGGFLTGLLLFGWFDPARSS
ncbi:rhomboid family intramembrane serine protease [Anderseniella sp. Alg231-50]|uniref:rhomboid family intramembrane serine protease n=1 Tax=Anderseniella sp. Alg231-50 TaxID=1922226 RepID=UPI000D54F693